MIPRAFPDHVTLIRRSLMANHRYQIIRQLGQSEFANTYLTRASDIPGAPKYILKQLSAGPEKSWMLPLLKQEAAILDRLHHSQIPQKVECFEDRGNFYLVQDFVEGDDLSKEFVVGYRWSEPKAVHFLCEMLKILSHVHYQQAIHCDVKPANIVRRWENGQFYLIDFGAVQDLSRNGTTKPANLGTAGYHAPEQAYGQASFSSDIYALGMTAIQFLTGRYPDHLPRDRHGDLRWRDLVKVSEPLTNVLERMTKRDVRERYGCTKTVLAALESLPTAETALPKRPVGQGLARGIIMATSMVLLSIGISALQNHPQPKQPAAVSEIPTFYNSKKN
jgi:eukaryotic-like serine/threonine-protein kinase